jgi:acyl carrier protein
VNRQAIEDRLCLLLGESAGLDPAGIDRSLPLLRGGLELDSLSVAALVAAVQAEFGFDLLEEDLTLASLESLAALAQFIEETVG